MLINGDELYRIKLAELQSENKLISRMLNVDELPKCVEYGGHQYDISYGDIIYGTLSHLDWNQQHAYNLSEAMCEFSERHEMGLIVVGGLCSALLSQNGKLVYFDSHSHDVNGMSAADGFASMITFEDAEQLTNFMYSYYHSCNVSMTAQFEIQILSIRRKQILNLHLTVPDESENSMLERYFEDQRQMQKEIEKDSCSKSTRRTYMKNYMKRKRSEDKMQREKDSKYTADIMKKRRQMKNSKIEELKVKQSRRKEKKYKEKEQKFTSKCMERLRSKLDLRKKEITRKRTKRKNAIFHEKEKLCTLKVMKTRRKDSELRKCEIEGKKEKRKALPYNVKEKSHTQEVMKKLRKNEDYERKEITMKQNKRKQSLYREKEKSHTSKCMQNLRNNDEYYKLKQNENSEKMYGSTIDHCIEHFLQKVSEGPIYVCSCCHQTWFQKSVVKLNNISLTQSVAECLTGYKSINNEEWICNTCLSTLKKGKVPKLSVRNGMQWPEKPSELNLHPLEERLISLRIPFMQIRELPRGRQLSS